MTRFRRLRIAILALPTMVSSVAWAVVQNPTFDPLQGDSLAKFNLKLNCATVGAEIHYTLDGSEPLITSPWVSSGNSISIPRDLTVKAKAFLGAEASTTVSATYALSGDVSAGGDFAYGLSTTGKVWAWGQQASGRLSNGVTTTASILNPLASKYSASIYMEDAAMVSAGYQHAVFLKQDKTVYAVGFNDRGQLGDASTTTRSYPVPVKLGTTAGVYLTDCLAVEVAEDFSLALGSNGKVYAWGDQDSGKLGNNENSSYRSYAGPVTTDSTGTPDLSGIVAISASRYSSLAREANAIEQAGSLGRVWGWGVNTLKQLGAGSNDNKKRASLIMLNSTTVLTDAWDIASGGKHSAVVRWKTGDSTLQGSVWCFGSQQYGRLGNGQTSDSNVSYPVQVLKSAGVPLTGIIAVSASEDHTLALEDIVSGGTSGKVWSWGYNPYGALGTGNTTNSGYAQTVKTLNSSGNPVDLTNIVRVSAGGNGGNNFSMALAADGSVYTWGRNNVGQLGLGGTTSTLYATKIANLKLKPTPPTVGLVVSTPSPNRPGVAVTLTATPADPDGPADIVKVEFYNGATKVGQATASPWTYNYTGLAAGTYSMKAVVTDTTTLTGESTVVPFTILANAAPQVTLSAAVTTSLAPGAATLTAVPTDANGAGDITKVEFYNGATKLGEKTSAPWTYAYTGLAAGSYSITAKVTDAGSATGVSGPANFTITAPAPVAPTVTLATTVTSNVAPGSVTLTASPVDGNGPSDISKVAFYNGTTLLTEVTSAPWTYVYNNIPAGSYDLKARVTDQGGLTGDSSVSTIIIGVPATAPTITLSLTAGNTVAPGSVTLAAAVADANGPSDIQKVEFYNQGQLVGTRTSAPWEYVLTSLAAGNHQLSAKVTDLGGLSATSQTLPYLVAAILDLDNDGMDDNWELLHGFDPNDPTDGLLDYDGDGRINYKEYQFNSDPKIPNETIQRKVAAFESSKFIVIPLVEPTSVNERFEIGGLMDDGSIYFRKYQTDEYNDPEGFFWKNGTATILPILNNSGNPAFIWANRGGWFDYHETGDEYGDSIVSAGNLVDGQITSLSYPPTDGILDEAQNTLGNITLPSGTVGMTAALPNGAWNYSTGMKILEDGTIFGEVTRRATVRQTFTRTNGSTFDTDWIYQFYQFSYWNNPDFASPFDGAHSMDPLYGRLEIAGSHFVTAGGSGENAFAVMGERDSEANSRIKLLNREGSELKDLSSIGFSSYILSTSRNGHIAQNEQNVVRLYRYPNAIAETVEFPGSEVVNVYSVNDIGDLLINDCGDFSTDFPRVLVRKFVDQETSEISWGKCVLSADKFPEGWSNFQINNLSNSMTLEQQRLLEAQSPPAYPPKEPIIGMMAGTAVKNEQQVPCLLVNASLDVDNNRDGNIILNDKTDKTTLGHPYRFWINNDRDQAYGDVYNATDDQPWRAPPTDSVNEDVQGDMANHIESERDLEDFTRFHIKIDNCRDALLRGDVILCLKWKKINGGNPIIRIYKNTDKKGDKLYLKSETASNAQFTLGRKAYGIVKDNSLCEIPKEFWSDIDEHGGIAHFLYEGVSEGTGELGIVFKMSGHEVGEGGPSVFLELSDIRRMYERAKISDTAVIDDPDKIAAATVSGIVTVSDPNGFNFSPAWDEDMNNKNYFIFVHGWRKNYFKATSDEITVFKRLWHQGFKGRFVGYKWPTYDVEGVTAATSAINSKFNHSEFRAWKCGIAFRDYVNGLPSNYKKNVAAHSLGNVVVSSALKEGMICNNYAMLNAAISAQCLDDSPSLVQSPSSEFYYFSYDAWDGDNINNDTNVSIRSRGYKGKAMVGGLVSSALINFYLEHDEATEGAWNANQWSGFSGSKIVKGYKYVPTIDTTYAPTLSSTSRSVTDTHEVMAMIDRSSTRSVGAEPRTAGRVTSSVNMDIPGIDFGTEHEAIFKYRCFKTLGFYRRLMMEMGYTPTL